MSMEGPPSAEQKKPSEVLDYDLVPPAQEIIRVSDEQCVQAMKTGDIAAVRAWYDEKSFLAAQDPTTKGHTDLTVRQAKLQLDAGLKDDAFETIEAAHWDAMNRGDFETARRLEDISDQLKER